MYAYKIRYTFILPLGLNKLFTVLTNEKCSYSMLVLEISNDKTQKVQ